MKKLVTSARSARTRSSRRSRSARRISGTATRRRRTRRTASRRRRISSARQAYRDAVRPQRIHLLPVNLYGPRDNFHPTNAHVIPDLIRKMHESPRRDRCSGATVADPRVPLRRGLRGRHRPGRRAVRRGRAGQPRLRRRAFDPGARGARRRGRGFSGRDQVGHVDAQRPAAPLPRRHEGRGGCSASGRGCRCARVSSARSPGTASSMPWPRRGR